MGIDELIGSKRDAIRAIAAKHGAYNLRVFGSVSRGDAGPESDIDLLFDHDPAKRTPWFPGGLIADLEAALGRRVDATTADGLHPLIRERVLWEAVPLLGNST